MFEFPEGISIPIEEAVEIIVREWLLRHLSGFFDAIGWVILQVMNGFEFIFTFIPWFIMIPIIFFLGFRLKNWKSAVIYSVMLFIIGTFGYYEFAMQTLSLVSAAVLFSLLIGVPLGILMAQSNRFEKFMQPLLDGMQTMPSFVYLIPALMLFGLGKVPAVIATIVYAMPPVIRLTNVGIREVDREVIEAAGAFGADRRQILWDVQIPLARASIMVGINQTTMMALAMVVIGSMIGARGLGLEVLLSINRIEVGRGFEAGLSIVFLAIIIDRLTYAVANQNFKKKKT